MAEALNKIKRESGENNKMVQIQFAMQMQEVQQKMQERQMMMMMMNQMHSS